MREPLDGRRGSFQQWMRLPALHNITERANGTDKLRDNASSHKSDTRCEQTQRVEIAALMCSADCDVNFIVLFRARRLWWQPKSMPIKNAPKITIFYTLTSHFAAISPQRLTNHFPFLHLQLCVAFVAPKNKTMFMWKLPRPHYVWGRKKRGSVCKKTQKKLMRIFFASVEEKTWSIMNTHEFVVFCSVLSSDSKL